MSRESKIVLGVAVVLLLVFGVALMAGANGQDKITICHAAGREGTTHFETLHLPPSAVFPNSQGNGGHFFENGTPRAGHEQDYFGECIPTTTTTMMTTTTEGPTTTTIEGSTTTLDPGTTTTVPLTSTTEATTSTSASDEGTTTIVTSPTTDPSAPTPDAPGPSSTDELPFTGMPSYVWAALGLALVGAGGYVLRLARRIGGAL